MTALSFIEILTYKYVCSGSSKLNTFSIYVLRFGWFCVYSYVYMCAHTHRFPFSSDVS